MTPARMGDPSAPATCLHVRRRFFFPPKGLQATKFTMLPVGIKPAPRPLTGIPDWSSFDTRLTVRSDRKM